MYKTTVKEFKAVAFDNGEVFITVANINENNKIIDWFVPEYIKDDFISLTQNEPIMDFMDKKILKKYKKWFIDKLSLENNSLDIETSIHYRTKNIIYEINNSFLRYNQQDTIEDCLENQNTKYYKDKNEKAIAYISDNQIVSIAHAEDSGLISLETLPNYRNKGYGTICIKKLINEFGKGMYICTQINNDWMRKIINKLEVELTNYGYWIKIKSKDAFKDKIIKGIIFE